MADLNITTDAAHRTIEVHVSGKLTAEDYKRLMPEVDQFIGQVGKVRLLFEMHDFHGWNAGAMWNDMRFALHHFHDIERLAMVGEKRWQKGMSEVCRPFTAAEIRFFNHDQMDQARTWLQEMRAVA